MALTKCAECGNEVSTQAKACPKCGAKNKPKRSYRRVAILLGIGAFVVAVVSNLATHETQKAEAARLASLTPAEIAAEQAKKELDGELFSAQNTCKRLVERNLHDPKTAEFEDPWTYWAEKNESGIYHVQVKVKAKNGFNATRKYIMDCKIRHVEGSWKLVELKELH